MTAPLDPAAGSSRSPRRAARTIPPSAGTPAGEAERAVSAPLAGQEWQQAAKTAQSAQAAAKLRARFTRAARRTGPGMIRRPPPDSAA